MKPLGPGRTSEVYEYIPARFKRQVHVQEVLSCQCGGGLVTAPPPAKGVDKGEYGPGFLAHGVTSKCADAMPLHVQLHPQSRIGELLPHEWKHLRAANSS